MTHSRFSGFEGTALPEVSGDDHRPIQRSLDAMEGVLRSSAGGTARTAGGAPGELEFYPREAVDEGFIDRFGIVGSAEYCAERLQEILDAGIARVYIGTRGVGIDLEETQHAAHRPRGPAAAASQRRRGSRRGERAPPDHRHRE